MAEKICELMKKGGAGSAKVDSGFVTISTSTSTKVTTGFKPSFVCVYGTKSTTQASVMVYSKETRDGYTFQAGKNGSATGGSYYTLPNTQSGNGYINSINDDGFTISGYGSTAYAAYTDNGKVFYVAVE